MTLLEGLLAAALAFLTGRLILWTSLARARDAVTLEAVRHEGGWVTDYTVSRLGLACRGDVLVRRADTRTIRQRSMRHRLQGLEPAEVVALLKAEGFRAELMPAGPGASHGGPAHPGVSFGTRWWRRFGETSFPALRALLKRIRGVSSGDAQ